MTTTTVVTAIKPQDNIRKSVQRLLSKQQLRYCEQAVKHYVNETVSEIAWLNEIDDATDEQAELWEVAPVECKRFMSAVAMTVAQALSIEFTGLDGYTTNSEIQMLFDPFTLRKSFSMFASGSFRRDQMRQEIPQLEMFFMADEEATAPIRLTVELEWQDVDAVPQAKLTGVSKEGSQVTKWLLSPLQKNLSRLIKAVNTTASRAGGKS